MKYVRDHPYTNHVYPFFRILTPFPQMYPFLLSNCFCHTRYYSKVWGIPKSTVSNVIYVENWHTLSLPFWEVCVIFSSVPPTLLKSRMVLFNGVKGYYIGTTIYCLLSFSIKSKKQRFEIHTELLILRYLQFSICHFIEHQPFVHGVTHHFTLWTVF